MDPRTPQKRTCKAFSDGVRAGLDRERFMGRCLRDEGFGCHDRAI